MFNFFDKSRMQDNTMNFDASVKSIEMDELKKNDGKKKL